MNMVNGTKVKLRVDFIQSDKTFDRKRDSYKMFVSENKNTVFTVTREQWRDADSPLISLKDESGKTTPWLFTEDQLRILK